MSIIRLQPTAAGGITAAAEAARWVTGGRGALDPILQKFADIEWHYATGDAMALAVLEERIAGAGRKRSLITYSELVRGVTFNLPNVQKRRLPYGWQDCGLPISPARIVVRRVDVLLVVDKTSLYLF